MGCLGLDGCVCYVLLQNYELTVAHFLWMKSPQKAKDGKGEGEQKGCPSVGT